MPLNPRIDDLVRARQMMPSVPQTPSPVEQLPQSNMFADLLAQISGANPNWAYDDAQVSQLDDAFRQQFEQQQSPYAVPTPAPQIHPPQMPTPSDFGANYAELYPEVMSELRQQHEAEARQVPGIPRATGGLDPARKWVGDPSDRRLNEAGGFARLSQGTPGIPTATPGMNRPSVDTPVHQMPRSERVGKPMSPMFEGPQRQPGMMTQRQPLRQLGMGQPLQQRPIQQQAPTSGSGTWTGHVDAGRSNIGGSRMPNTGRMTSSFGGQRQSNQPGMPGQPGMFGGPGQPQQRGGFLPAAPGGGGQFGRPSAFGMARPGGGGGSPHWTNRAQGVGAAAQRPVDTGGPTTLGNFLERERRLSPGG